MEQKKIYKEIGICFIIPIMILVMSTYGLSCISKAETTVKSIKMKDGSKWKYQILDDETAEIIFVYSPEEDVVIPKTVNGYRVTRIAENGFQNREDIVSVIIPEGITDIGKNAFWNCDYLERVELPTTLKKIDKYAFAYCESLENVKIPSNVNTIDEYAFGYCDNLETVVISWGVETIGKGAFVNCDALKDVDIPYTVKEIGENAFHSCHSLTNVRISSNIEEIKAYTFAYCTSLKSIKIPSSVKRIDRAAFLSCTDLNRVYIYRKNINICGESKRYMYRWWDGEEYMERRVCNSSFYNCPNLTIYASTGSAAVTYAKEQKITLKIITKLDDISTFNIQLSKDAYAYNGRDKRPTVTIKSNRGILKKTNYTIQYKNNVNIGRATVIIKGKGRYTGTVKKTFIIRPATPKVTAKNVGSGIKVSWNRISGAKGYYVYRRTNGKWKRIGTIKSVKKLYYYDKKAKSGTTYRYTVRAYRGTVKSKYKATPKIKCK